MPLAEIKKTSSNCPHLHNMLIQFYKRTAWLLYVKGFEKLRAYHYLLREHARQYTPLNRADAPGNCQIQ